MRKPDPDTIVIDAEIVTDWLHVADQREDPLWEQVESLLNELQKKYPIRARKARMAVRWLRHEALALNLPWGKEMNSYAESRHTQDNFRRQRKANNSARRRTRTGPA